MTVDQPVETAPSGPKIPPVFGRAPAWKSNLLLFGLLISVALLYFFWQAQSAHRAFLSYAREHSRMIAGVIELNARGALLSQEAVEKVLGLFLSNTARFVDYLDTVEPFSNSELTEFAYENGLAGIRIGRGDGRISEGPPDWFPESADRVCRAPDGVLRHLPSRYLHYLDWPRTEGPGCVTVGLTSVEIDTLQDRIGIDRLLESLTGLTGIRYVRMEANTADETTGPPGVNPAAVVFQEDAGEKIAEIRRPVGANLLVVGLEAGPLFSRTRQLWEEFLLFCGLLGSLGLFFSWLLHRNQAAYIARIQSVERELAREREDAVLGRSAAAIAHEIRNPLNAIGMGLQRLGMEAEGLGEEDRAMVTTMLQALKRADSIIDNIRLYARPLKPRFRPVRLGRMFRDSLALYQGRFAAQAIHMEIDIPTDAPVAGDPHLLEQVAENLIKNALEAQPEGGFLRIQMEQHQANGVLHIENSGFALPPEDAGRITEPYFTTKTRGTGLGLAIVHRIVQAHRGRLDISVPRPKVLRVTISVPLHGKAEKGDHADTHR